MVIPSAFAVVKPITSSNFVCSIGMSLAFAPLRILSTWVAARRNMSALAQSLPKRRDIALPYIGAVLPEVPYSRHFPRLLRLDSEWHGKKRSRHRADGRSPVHC